MNHPLDLWVARIYTPLCLVSCASLSYEKGSGQTGRTSLSPHWLIRLQNGSHMTLVARKQEWNVIIDIASSVY